MAKPRIFISSTFYDLRQIRSELDLFIQTLGYDTILSEKGNINIFSTGYAHQPGINTKCPAGHGQERPPSDSNRPSGRNSQDHSCETANP